MIDNGEEMRLLRLKRVAFILDTSLRQVHTLCAQGVLERVRIGPRSSRVTRESIERFIADARSRSRT